MLQPLDLMKVGNSGLPAHAANQTDDLQEDSSLMGDDDQRLGRAADRGLPRDGRVSEALRTIRNLRFDEMRQQRQRFLPSQIAELDRIAGGSPS